MIKEAKDYLKLLEQESNDIFTVRAPEDVWLELIINHPETRIWVARNKHLPISILDVLADDVDGNVRCWIAFKRKLTSTLFEKLADDPLPWIRQRIACNVKVPLPILRKLSVDKDNEVAEIARENLVKRLQNNKMISKTNKKKT